MYNRFNQSQQLSPAQRAVLASDQITSDSAVVLSKAETGLYQNAQGIDTCTIWVEMSERLGHPLRLTGLASVAKSLSALEVGDHISFGATIHGSLRRGRSPYAIASEVVKL